MFVNKSDTCERGVEGYSRQTEMIATPEVLGELIELLETGSDACCYPEQCRMLRDPSFKIVRRWNVEWGKEAGEGRWRF